MRRNGKLHRILYGGAVSAMLLTLASCGLRNTPPSSASAPGAEEASEIGRVAVAEIQYMPLYWALNYADDYVLNKEWLYYVDIIGGGGEAGPYTAVSRQRISDGHVDEHYILSPGTTLWMREKQILADAAGNCYIFWMPWVKNEENIFTLSKYGPEGEPIWHTEYAPEELLDMGDLLDQGTVTEDGRVFLYSYGEDGRVFAFGVDGSLEEVYVPSLERLERIAAGKGGEVYAYCITGEEQTFVRLGETQEEYACPIYPHQVFDGYGMGILLRNAEGMWAYEPETGGTELLWRWGDEYVQLDGSRMSSYFCDGETFLMMFQEQYFNGYSTKRQILTLVTVDWREGGEFPERQTVTLSSSFDSVELELLVRLYNRQRRKYRIETTLMGAKALETQLLHGQAADLIEVSGMYADNLAEVGAFEDLTPYYGTAGAPEWGGILGVVREACTIRGRNVAVIPAFSINTMRARDIRYAPEEWTVWNFLGEGDGGESVLYQQSPLTALRYCMGIKYGEHFVDFKNKTCNFDSDEFRQVLEACSKWGSYRDSNEPFSIFIGTFKDGDRDVLYEDYGIQCIWDMVSEEDGHFSARLVGRPGWNGGEHELRTNVAFAMNSSSENKEGAWDFLAYVLSAEVQDMISDWYNVFPVREESFETRLSEMYIAPSAAKWVTVVPDQEDAARLRKIVDAAVFQSWAQRNNPIWDIVNDEAQMYFAGDCPLEETVEKIQSRVQLYLDEM